MRRSGLLVAALLASAGMARADVAPAEPPAVAAHVAAAERIAGADLREPLFLCRADSLKTVFRTLETRSQVWIEPTRLFDNLYYVGNGFVGQIVLRTSAGLILFDSGESEDNVRNHLVPGLVTLGLDPATIRYVVVTHGHFDHFGGAAYIQKTYGAHVALSAADWDLIARLPLSAREVNGRVAPTRDHVIADGETLALGDTAVRLYVTPGHTPGTVSAILPAREGGTVHPLSLLGSTAFPATDEPTATTGGLAAYVRSVRRFAAISADAGAQGILNTHVFADGTEARLAAARERRPGAPNPFLTGATFTARYYQVLDQCLLAAEARLGKAS